MVRAERRCASVVLAGIRAVPGLASALLVLPARTVPLALQPAALADLALTLP